MEIFTVNKKWFLEHLLLGLHQRDGRVAGDACVDTQSQAFKLQFLNQNRAWFVQKLREEGLVLPPDAAKAAAARGKSEEAQK
eukprot:3930003-Rhodomonas_salina.1